jgi:hypothetical protein
MYAQIYADLRVDLMQMLRRFLWENIKSLKQPDLPKSPKPLTRSVD